MGAEEETTDFVVEESAVGDDQSQTASPESEGEAAADYLEGLLDIIDADGDIDIDMEGERTRVSVIEVNEVRPTLGQKNVARRFAHQATVGVFWERGNAMVWLSICTD